MILNDLEEFTEFVPTAAGSDLNELKPFIEESEYWLKTELFGDDLYEAVSLPETNPAVLRTAKTVVCLHAYLSAIPFVDLIQTPTGFAVVNNTNQSPASKERVERLIAFVEKRLTDTIDRVITSVHLDADLKTEWRKAGPLFERLTEIVYLTTVELKNYSGNKQASYKDLFDCRPAVLALQSEVANYISADYLDELIEKRRRNDLSDFDRHVFSALQSIIGLKLQKADAYALIEKLVNYMLSHPDEFPAYLASAEYQLKISQKYENKKNDPTFFFGG
jgi:hypothetical protein